jgi:nitroreductase
VNTLDSIRLRRTIRRYKPEPVPEELFRAVIEAARWAPTSGNLQPWEMIRILTPALREAIVGTTYGGYTQSAPSQSWLLEAPELIVVCVNALRTMARYGPDGETYARIDTAAAIQNMLLAATSLGLGAAWVGGFRADEAKVVLSLDQDLEPFGLVVLGYPSEVPPTPYRLPLEDILSER